MPGKTQSTDSFMLSVITPMYNEDNVIDAFFTRIIPVLESITSNFELVCINDGSSDDTLKKLKAAHELNPRIKYVDLSRNYGKEIALSAGLSFAGGDAIVPIDADLQDPPELIAEMVEKWRQGYDMVLAKRSNRDSDGFAKRFFATTFYRIMKHVGEVPFPENAGDFRLMDKRVVAALQQFPERNRVMKGLFALLGFKQTSIEYVRPKRAAGTTKWSAWKLWNLGLEGILSFTTMPLRIWTYIGGLLAMFALSYASFIMIRTVIYGIDVPGYASLLVVILFFSGMNMVGIGILGEYLGRIFLEVKQRPLYLVRETGGFDEV